MTPKLPQLRPQWKVRGGVPSPTFSYIHLQTPPSSRRCVATRSRTQFIWAFTGTQQAGGQRGGGASFGRADAAQVCNHVGFAAADDGPFECSGTKAARRIVSERWRDDTVHCCYARAHTPARSHNARGRLRVHTRTHISNFCQKRGAAVLITCVDCEIRRQTGSCN